MVEAARQYLASAAPQMLAPEASSARVGDPVAEAAAILRAQAPHLLSASQSGGPPPFRLFTDSQLVYHTFNF